MLHVYHLGKLKNFDRDAPYDSDAIYYQYDHDGAASDHGYVCHPDIITVDHWYVKTDWMILKKWEISCIIKFSHDMFPFIKSKYH